MAEGRDLGRWLEEVRAEYWSRLSALDTEVERTGRLHVLFRLGSRAFAVEAALCRGVVRKTRVARLPGIPPHVLGVAGVRGEVVSATDPLALLGLPASERSRGESHGYLLILAAGPLKTAAWVDWVDDVVMVDDERVLAIEAPWPGAPEGLLRGAWQGREPPVLVLDGCRYLEMSAVRADLPG